MKAVAGMQKIKLPADVSIQSSVSIGPMTGKAGAFGIAEPPRDRPVLLGELDALLIPGLGFTRDGHRLGRGGGAMPASYMR